MNRGSTIGKNINYIMWKYDIPPKMCRGTYVGINKLITKWYNNNIKTDDDINASDNSKWIQQMFCRHWSKSGKEHWPPSENVTVENYLGNCNTQSICLSSVEESEIINIVKN